MYKMFQVSSVFSIIFAFCIISIHSLSKEHYEYCIDSKYHKETPGKESKLHQYCSPWQDYSCCKEETSIRVHQDVNQYKFDLDHCEAQTNTRMSDECRRHFMQDLCFYECEPNVKPWVVKVNRTFAKERIFKVPLCASDCESWWNACKFDYTCAYNWARGFKWINGKNVCPQNSLCQPLYKVYDNAKQFCESVWDHSWEFTYDHKPCMRIWFNGTLGNPNRATAEWYAGINYRNTSPSKVSKNCLWEIIIIATALMIILDS